MKNLVVLDCEVYPNYTLLAFKKIDNNNVLTFEIKGADNSLSDLDSRRLSRLMSEKTTFGFNSINYDMPIILSAIKQKSAKQIFNISNYIIENNSKSWQTLQKFGLFKPDSFKHFDIQEPSPGVKISLKMYGARLNSKTLQDLPIEPGQSLSNEDMENIKLYCLNDLNTTIDLYRSIEDRIKLRVEMSEKYNIDLLSKSDAQIAEAVIKEELTNIDPYIVLYAPKYLKNATFKYEVPSFIKFKTEELKLILEQIEDYDFKLDDKGSIILPSDLKKAKIKLGKTIYQLGIGGIHSTEKSQVIIPKNNQLLIDQDVASYYPSIILNQKLYPKHLTSDFLTVYKEIVDERLKAKREGNKIVNESLKIVINGSFGKFGNKYSVLYSPDLMIAVTLTGQLALLMLIEELELNGISVVSANTDGFVSLMNKDLYKKYQNICFDWALLTGFELEETKYKALYSRDVNNYLAITEAGKTKGKGIFTIDSIAKNPSADICIEAVISYLKDNKNISDTIKNCTDLTKFLMVRSVTGGAVFKDKYLGRVVRWIYSTDGDTIKYKKNGNKVAKSDGSRPIMILDELPNDIDYKKYILESMSILTDLNLCNF